MNREEWLSSCAKALEPIIKAETGLSIRPYRVSCGWPSRSGMAPKNRTIGQCQVSGSVKGIQDIFISPTLDNPDAVIETLLHELLHAALPPGTGHRKLFSQTAKKVGLEGKPTATYASDALRERLGKVMEAFPSYPHDRIELSGLPKQSTRLLKAMCPICGYIVRVTSKWLDEVGAPICPQCACDMVYSEPGEEPSDPLVAVDQTVEYKVKGAKGEDPRWSVRMIRHGRNYNWFIIDYGDAIFEPGLPRLTPADTRQDAIDLIDSLRAGLLTYAEIEVNDELTDEDWTDEDFLDDGEDEEPDHEDSVLGPDEEDGYVAEEAKREDWVKV